MSQKVDPSPTRHADTPRSQKGLAPLTRDPWFTFLVWGTSCEHNFSWTFLAGLQALSPFTKLLKFWVLVCPSPTRHADTPRSQKGLAPLTRDPWFTFLVWGTSCEHNFSWTFRRPLFWDDFWHRFLAPIFRLEKHDEKLPKMYAFLAFSSYRCPRIPIFQVFGITTQNLCKTRPYLVIPVRKNTLFS